MVTSKVCYALSAVVTTALAAIAPIHPSAINIPAIGMVSVMEANTAGAKSDTRLYYQHNDTSIAERLVDGPFTRNHTSTAATIIPVGQAALGTNIAAVFVGTPFSQKHVFFVSATNVLNEYMFNGTWTGGASCTQCIQANNFLVTPGSKILYALSNPDFYELRVGFISPAFPDGSITEAVQSTAGGPWVLGVL